MPPPIVTPLPPEAPFDGGPLSIAARWKRDHPLLMLGSGQPHPRWSRWSVLAEPTRWVVVDADEPEPLAALTRALGATRRGAAPAGPIATSASVVPSWTGGAHVDEIPFLGGWIGFLAYDLGCSLEPKSHRGPRRPRPDDHQWPLAAFAWCPTALVHDSARHLWWSVAHDDAASATTLVESGVDDGRRRGPEPWSLAPLANIVSRRDWTASVERAIEYIRAGDIFQANLAHPLRSTLRGAPRDVGLAALEAVQPWHGALLELPDGSAIVSLSPELFLQGNLPPAAGGRAGAAAPGFLVTRPIKGTRPDGDDPESLMRSEKDAAELNMIVDLMRNDLGRVCRPGSVRVSEQRHVELHPTVHQAVATVEGAPRDDVDLAALLRATFPPGSVTGAPKVRAMQIIEELEPFERGPYCGAIGFFGDDGTLALNVAIRTLTLAPPRMEPAGGSSGAGTAGSIAGAAMPPSTTPAEGASRGGPGGPSERISGPTRAVTYGVGCGIVADSDPAAEWDESMAKAKVAERLGSA